MVADIQLYNLGLIIVIVALLVYQLKRFTESVKPIQQHPCYFIIDGRKSHTEKEYAEEERKFKKKYNRDMFVYLITYLLPIIFALFSFISIINLEIGIIMLILAIISTIIMEIIIKVYGVGEKKIVSQV